MDDYYQNGDLDFDGTSYWPEWPTGPQPTAKFPGSFVQSLPTTGRAQYSQFFLQTDTALSESTCGRQRGRLCSPARTRPATSTRIGRGSAGAPDCTSSSGTSAPVPA